MQDGDQKPAFENTGSPAAAATFPPYPPTAERIEEIEQLHKKLPGATCEVFSEERNCWLSLFPLCSERQDFRCIF